MVFGIPVGSIGAITIKRALRYGWKAGISSGMGCSVADVMYASISIFGMTIISDFLFRYQMAISIFGGILIIVMGVYSIRKDHKIGTEIERNPRGVSFFTSSFVIAGTNPTTIFTFVLAFSIFNVGKVNNFSEGVSLAGGIFLGTGLWWVIISVGFYALRSRLTEKGLSFINTALGCFIVLLGSIVITSVFFS